MSGTQEMEAKAALLWHSFLSGPLFVMSSMLFGV